MSSLSPVSSPDSAPPDRFRFSLLAARAASPLVSISEQREKKTSGTQGTRDRACAPNVSRLAGYKSDSGRSRGRVQKRRRSGYRRLVYPRRAV